MQGPAEYVYGVTQASASVTLPSGGVANAPVRPLVVGGLAAIASEVGAEPIRARKRDLACHADVVAAAFEKGPVIPLRFGTVFPDGAAVEAFLEERGREFGDLLRELDGVAELRLTAFYDEDAILREIVGTDRRVAQLRAATQSRPAAAARGLRLELGERVAARLGARADADARLILDTLRSLARKIVVEERLAELQVLRASFLVDRPRRFDEEVEALARREAPRLRFKLIGPMAPHSFVSLQKAAA